MDFFNHQSALLFDSVTVIKPNTASLLMGDTAGFMDSENLVEKNTAFAPQSVEQSETASIISQLLQSDKQVTPIVASHQMPIKNSFLTLEHVDTKFLQESIQPKTNTVLPVTNEEDSGKKDFATLKQASKAKTLISQQAEPAVSTPSAQQQKNISSITKQPQPVMAIAKTMLSSEDTSIINIKPRLTSFAYPENKPEKFYSTNITQKNTAQTLQSKPVMHTLESIVLPKNNLIDTNHLFYSASMIKGTKDRSSVPIINSTPTLQVTIKRLKIQSASGLKINTTKAAPKKSDHLALKDYLNRRSGEV